MRVCGWVGARGWARAGGHRCPPLCSPPIHERMQVAAAALLPLQQQQAQAAAAAVAAASSNGSGEGVIMGAILIFLPGWDEIVRLKEKLESSAAFGGSRWVVQGGWEVREVWKRLAPSDLHPRRPRQLAHPCPPTHARPPMPAAPLHSPGTSCCRCTRWWRPQSSAACLCAPPRGCARSSWPPTLLKRPLPSMTWCASSTRVGGRVGGWVHVSVHASVPARAGGRRVRATPPPAPPPPCCTTRASQGEEL